MVNIAEVFVLPFVGLNGGSSCVEFFLRPRFELTWAIRSNHVHRHHLDCFGFSVCVAPAYESQWPFLSLPAKNLNYGRYDVVNDELPASQQREPMLIPS